jgi:hypothetical protein
LYISSINAANGSETGQIYTGQNSGLYICTTTAHPIKLSANKFAGKTTPSVEIQATGNKNVVINSPLVYKPYASLLITTSGGVVSVANYGYCPLTTASVTRVGTNQKAYTITFPAAHPNAANFAVIACAYTSGSTFWNGTNDLILTTKVETGGTAISVWCRRPGLPSTTGLIDGSFYVYTVP